MLKKTIASVLLISLSTIGVAQKSKINAAWRGLTDYQATLKEKPEPSYLLKAKDAIDLAAANEETKSNPKTHIYRTQIYYELFKINLKVEEEKAAATTGDKKQRMEVAYSTVNTAEFKEAIKSVEFVKTNSKDQSAFQELLTTSLSMIDDLNNLAVGSYKAKKYDEASDYFENSFNLSSMVNQGRKDTVSLFNASLSAQKAKNFTKVAKINQRMIDEKMANAATYQYLYTAKLNVNDTAGAFTTLQEGRKAYPADVSLLNTETQYYLMTGKQAESINNLNIALEKEPNNPLLHLILAGSYDGMMAPKGPDGKELPRPANADSLFTKAETHYKKAIELKPTAEYLYNANLQLGAMYNNQAIYISNEFNKNVKITELARKQKEVDAKCDELIKKAVPYLEEATVLRPDDVSTLQALRKLYLRLGNEAKAAEISVKLNKGK